MYASGASHHYKNFGKLSKVRDVAVNLRHSSNDMEHMLRQVGDFSCPKPVFCPVPSYSAFIMHCACLVGLRAVTVGFGAPAASRSEPCSRCIKAVQCSGGRELPPRCMHRALFPKRARQCSAQHALVTCNRQPPTLK